MAHGHPDYGPGAPVSTIYPVLDIGELAARLGSTDTFDRRGNVLWFDGFKCGISKWLPHTLGSGASFSWQPTAARNGGFSARCITGDSIENYAGMSTYFIYRNPTKLGFEFSYAVDSINIYWDARLLFYTGTEQLYIEWRWTGGSDRYLQIYDENGSWVTIDSFQQLASSYFFHTAKIVFDTENKAYTRLLVDNHSYDLTAYPLRAEADTANDAYMELYIYFYTLIALNLTAYVDDVIVTQNEP